MAWGAAIHGTRKQRAGEVRPKGNDAQMEILTDKGVSFPSISPSSRIIPTVYGFRPVYHSIGDAFGMWCGVEFLALHSIAQVPGPLSILNGFLSVCVFSLLLS